MSDERPSCPLPFDGSREVVTLAHGEGARLSRQFIRNRLLTRLGNHWLDQLGDGAQLPASGNHRDPDGDDSYDEVKREPRWTPGILAAGVG